QVSVQIERLEQRILELESQRFQQQEPSDVNHDYLDDGFAMESLSEKVHFSGFASFGLHKFANVADGAALDDRDTQLSTTNATVLGLQMEFELASSTAFIFQLKAFANGDNNVEAEWAYLNHKFDQNWNVRIGAMRVPFFMLSEYLDVGYAHVWANTPTEVYGGTIDLTFTGANLGYDFNLGSTQHLLQFYAGTHYSTDIDPNIRAFSVDDLLGLRYDLYWDQWRLGVSYTQGDANATLKSGDPTDPSAVPPQAVLPKNSAGVFIGAGLFYEGEQLSWQTEWVHQQVDAPYQDEMGWYTSLAYRIDKWTPYTYYGELKTTDDENRKDTLLPLLESYSQRSVAAGLRYDVYKNYAIKVEVIHILDEHYSDRIQRPELSSGDAEAGVGGNFYTLKLDMVF
ncbi:MAG: porin, partial [Pseudomonadales bacterium]|nr:porin [Pseudomonadales bacterium]